MRKLASVQINPQCLFFKRSSLHYQSVRSAKCEERLDKSFERLEDSERDIKGLICTPSDEKKNRERRARKKSRIVGEKSLTFLLLT